MSDATRSERDGKPDPEVEPDAHPGGAHPDGADPGEADPDEAVGDFGEPNQSDEGGDSDVDLTSDG